MWIQKKTVWWIMIYLAFGLCSARRHQQHNYYRRGSSLETLQNANEPSLIGSSGGRAKREGFVDFNAIPDMMRGFAHNLGRGLNNMVQHSQHLGQRVVNNMMHSVPNIIYGNWKPINTHSQRPLYPPPIKATPSPYTPSVEFAPVLEPAKPIFTATPEPIFIKPEPVYKPTPGPIYTKPFPTEDTYGQPISEIVKPFEFDEFTSPGFLVNPVSVTTTSIPFVEKEIPAEYSQNPDHVNIIAKDTLFYKDVTKLKSKPKSVEGDLANYRPKPNLLRRH